MRRPSVVILFLLVGLYAGAAFLGGMGVYTWADHQVHVADQDEFEAIIEAEEPQHPEDVDESDEDGSMVELLFNIRVFGGGLESLHGMYTSVSGTFSSLVAAAQYGPSAIGSIPGVSTTMVNYITAGLGLVLVLDVLYVLAGRRL